MTIKIGGRSSIVGNLVNTWAERKAGNKQSTPVTVDLLANSLRFCDLTEWQMALIFSYYTYLLTESDFHSWPSHRIRREDYGTKCEIKFPLAALSISVEDLVFLYPSVKLTWWYATYWFFALMSWVGKSFKSDVSTHTAFGSRYLWLKYYGKVVSCAFLLVKRNDCNLMALSRLNTHS